MKTKYKVVSYQYIYKTDSEKPWWSGPGPLPFKENVVDMMRHHKLRNPDYEFILQKVTTITEDIKR